MRVFVTGASGWIGSAVVPELLDAGHQVIGLARSEASAAALAAAGAEVRTRHARRSRHPAEPRRPRRTASSISRSSTTSPSPATSRARPTPIAAPSRRSATRSPARTGRSSSPPGRSGWPPGGWPPERDGLAPGSGAGLAGGPQTRRATARLTLALADRGVRSSVLRLPPTVHGDGDHGFLATLVGVARDNGVSGYVGDGSNRWPAVHRFDAAHLFRLALEKHRRGRRCTRSPTRACRSAPSPRSIGRHLDLPGGVRRSRGRSRALRLAGRASSRSTAPPPAH